MQSQKFNSQFKQMVLFKDVTILPSITENPLSGCIYINPAVLKNDGCRTLSACEFGELMAIKNYVAALKENLHPQASCAIMELHLTHLKKVMKDIDTLNVLSC